MLQATDAKVLSVVYVALANFCLIYTHSAAWSLFGEQLVRRLRERYLAALLFQGPAFLDELSAHLAGDLGDQRLHPRAGDEHLGGADPLAGDVGQPAPAIGTDADDEQGRGEGLTHGLGHDG